MDRGAKRLAKLGEQRVEIGRRALLASECSAQRRAQIGCLARRTDQLGRTAEMRLAIGRGCPVLLSHRGSTPQVARGLRGIFAGDVSLV